MKKSKLLILGLIALMLVSGLVVLASCDSRMCEGNCYYTGRGNDYEWYGCCTKGHCAVADAVEANSTSPAYCTCSK